MHCTMSSPHLPSTASAAVRSRRALAPRKRSFEWLVALWLALVGLASASLAQAAGPGRPFKASLELDHRLGRSTSCTGLDGQPGPGGTFGGTGHATHMGAVELHSTHCITVPADPEKPVYVFNGRMRVTTPNGDVMLADYAGYFNPVSDGVYAFEGNYYITGGTGRFEDASGTGALFGNLQGYFNVVLQAATLSAQGRIRY
jgi:hypothetical protein